MKKQTVTTRKPLARGFAAMKPEAQRRIASMGGKAAMSIKGRPQMLGRLGGLNSHRGDPGRAA